MLVGLGNIGKNYEKTRHNVGQWFIKNLAQSINVDLKKNKKFSIESSNVMINNEACVLILPQSYMNESGRIIAKFSKFYNIDSENILIVHDDIDLSCGSFKWKIGGGHGGHNGLKNINKCIGNNNYNRLRIGINHPGNKDQVPQYVLDTPSIEEQKVIMKCIKYTTQLFLNNTFNFNN